jgi:hypothetical protein
LRGGFYLITVATARCIKAIIGTTAQVKRKKFIFAQGFHICNVLAGKDLTIGFLLDNSNRLLYF